MKESDKQIALAILHLNKKGQFSVHTEAEDKEAAINGTCGSCSQFVLNHGNNSVGIRCKSGHSPQKLHQILREDYPGKKLKCRDFQPTTQIDS